MDKFLTEYPQFFTATNLWWNDLLKPLKYKDIIMHSLRFLVKNKRIRLFAFVIMDNHIHLIWQMMPEHRRQDVQRDFLKYTAQRIQKDLARFHPEQLAKYKVKAYNREYQFWERYSLSTDLWTHAVFLQKLNYIHQNPVKAGMCRLEEEYKYSSAAFYARGYDHWGILTHYRD